MNTEAIFMGLGLSAQNSPFCCVPSPRFSNLMRRSLLTTNVGFHQYAFHGSLTGHVSDIFKSQLVVKEGCVESPILSDHNSSFNSSSGRQPHLLPTTASKRKQNIKQHPTFVNDGILSSRPHVYRNSMANMSDQVDRLSRNTWLEETKRLKEIRTFHPRLCNAMDIQSTAHILHDESKIVEKLNPQGGSYSWSQSLDSVHIKGEFSNSHVQGHLATITENSQTLSKRILNKKLYRQTHIEHKNRVFLSSKDANKKFLGNYDLNKYKQTPEVMMSSQNMGRINNQSVATDVNKQYNSTGNHSTINILKEAATKVLSDYEQKLFKLERVEISNDVNLNDKESGALDLLETYVEPINFTEKCDIHSSDDVSKLTRIYDKVLVIDNVLSARRVVKMLTTKYKHLIHACDTEVAKIDVKTETPVDHGEIICFSIFSGSDVDFGDGKSCIWVDVLDGSRDVLMEFAPFFEDPSIRKVWHNYSFDCHIIENYGIKVSGFHADTMHLARLWDSSRRMNGGYSLEALTGDRKVMNGAKNGEFLVGKISMKSIFGKKKIKKDGSEGKIITMAPVEELQREERIPWICYSALDSISTLRLFESLKKKLLSMKWTLDGVTRGTMYDFYEEYWKPFGEILVKMETEGMLVDRSYLSEVEKVAVKEQQIAADWFRKWASKYCPDAMYMNVGSDAQLRQLFFGGVQNRKNPNESLPHLRVFKVPNTEGVIEEGKKAPSKYRSISLHNLGVEMQTETYTSSGWPSVSGDALKALAGKVSTEEYHLINETDLDSDNNDEMGNESISNETDVSLNRNEDSSYGTAFAAFRGDEEGREACYAIASLCEVCSIDSLISNFILPLQGSHISGKYGRVHCSLNINTETGRLSARRPNLQNQPALEKDRYKIRQAFIAEPGNSLVVADYGQLELRILAHLSNCKSMLDAFKAGGDFHSRTAMNMYPYIKDAVEEKRVLLEWYPQPGEEKPPVPLLKDAFASERRKAKMLNFSIAYGKTPVGLSRDWKVSLKEAKETVDLWYKERKEVLLWQDERKKEAREKQCVYTLLGRARRFPSLTSASNSQRGHIERAAINTPVQGSAADVAMCAMIEISRNTKLKELGWRLLLQVHDEVILEGPTESAEVAKAIVVECMSKPFYGTNFLKVDLVVDSKCAQNWYAAK